MAEILIAAQIVHGCDQRKFLQEFSWPRKIVLQFFSGAAMHLHANFVKLNYRERR